MQPAPIVSTPGRLINGGLSGLMAQLVGTFGTAYLMAHGMDPGTSSIVATAAGSAVSGTMATIGDWSRGVLETRPEVHPLAKLPLMLGARIG